MSERISDERLRELLHWCDPDNRDCRQPQPDKAWEGLTDALRELAELREQVRWRPMEEAPKDGNRLLLRFRDQTIIGYWRKDVQLWFGVGVQWYDGALPVTDLRDGWGKGGPTAWMPMPSDPEIGPLPGGDA